jgi:HAD superfamily phosphoserine phosphatase-like hydrolase
MLFACRDKLVPFVGAGLSSEFGYPTWNKLLERLASQAGLDKEVRQMLADNKFEEAAELISEALPNVFDDTLRSTFNHNELKRPIKSGAVRYLPMIARGPVITTNFDRVIETAFADYGVPFADTFAGSHIREASRALQLGQPFLLKLHGDYLDSGSRILTLKQYTQQYGHSDPTKVDLNHPLPIVLGQALGNCPMLFLGCSLRNDRTIVVMGRIAKRLVGSIHFALLSESENLPERRKELDVWNIRPLFYPRGNYKSIDEFLACLALYCGIDPKSDPPRWPSPSRTNAYFDVQKSGARLRRLKQRRSVQLGKNPVRINGYKLFYFRATRKMSLRKLSESLGLDRQFLGNLERVSNRLGRLSAQRFQLCNRHLLRRIERALGCGGKLQAGKSDDFLTQFMHFYHLYKGKHITKTATTDQLEIIFHTKVVVFDFDGTLTKRSDDQTTWETIWVRLGYSINDCAELHKRFQQKEFSHQEWCNITLDRFKARKLQYRQLEAISSEMSLVEGARETIETLRNAGLKLFILSGSIKQIIKQVMNDLYHHFEEVHANEMIFDSTGTISKIVGTPYDFEGKATFLKRVIEDNQLSPLDVLFVGNSCNDVWASQSGVRTLCVNPRFTDPDEESEWTYSIRRMENLAQILTFIKI